MAETYEQHVFGLELQDKFLGPLAKSAKLLEKNAAAWDKFESRVRGGGMDKAMAKVNGLIGRYEKLEAVIKRIGAVKVSVSGGPAGHHDAALQSEQRFSAYRIRIDRKHAAEKERLDRQAAAAALRAEQQRNREEERFSAYRIRLARKEATEKMRESDRAMRAELRAISTAAKAAARAREKASHKYYFGGETSFGSLYRRQHEGQVGGLASSLASSVAGSLTPLSLAGKGAGLLGTAAGAVADAGVGVAGFALSLGSAAVSAQSMRESSVEAFRAIYGVAANVDKLFDSARFAAQQTKFDTKDVVGIYNTLAANNFKIDELPKYFAAVADIESARKGKGATFLNAISKIRSNATASFGQVQSAGLQGPGIENTFAELAKRKNITQPMTRKDWMKLFKDGAVTREEALDAVTQAVAKKYDTKTGQLGEFSKAQGGTTFAGVLSNIKNALPDILNMKLPDDHPIFQFKKILLSLGAPGGLFDSTSAKGKRFSQLVADFVSDIFLPFGGINLKNTDDLMDRLLTAGEQLRGKFHEMMVEISKGVKNFLGDSKVSLVQLGADVGLAIGKAIVSGAYEGLGQITGLGRYSSVIQGSSGKAWGNLASDAFDKVNVWGGGGTPAALPEFGAGGTVPGPYGEKRLAIVHSGEEYLGVGAARRGGGGGSGSNITIESLTIMCDSPMTLESFRVMLTEVIEEEAEVAA